MTAGQASWYSLEVEDQSGRKAYTNPIWIDWSPLPRRPSHAESSYGHSGVAPAFSVNAMKPIVSTQQAIIAMNTPPQSQ